MAGGGGGGGGGEGEGVEGWRGVGCQSTFTASKLPLVPMVFLIQKYIKKSFRIKVPNTVNASKRKESN